MKKFLNDFKAFALKGNVVDMAIGVVVGGAFSKIVTSLVNDIITPLIGLLTGNISLVDLKLILAPAVLDAVTGEVITPELVVTYGAFLQTVIDFLIIALSIFMVMKIAMNARNKIESMKKKEEEAVEEVVEEATDTELSVLLEIRELLKKD